MEISVYQEKAARVRRTVPPRSTNNLRTIYERSAVKFRFASELHNAAREVRERYERDDYATTRVTAMRFAQVALPSFSPCRLCLPRSPGQANHNRGITLYCVLINRRCTVYPRIHRSFSSFSSLSSYPRAWKACFAVRKTGESLWNRCARFARQ